MEEHGNFNYLDEQLQRIITALLNDENIAKLMYYATGDALSQPPVPDPYSLLRTQLYTQPFRPPVDKSSVFLTVFFESFDALYENPFLKKGKLYIGICIHRDLWELDNGLRPYKLMGAIDKILNRNHVSNSITKDFFGKADFRQISDLYNGYDLEYFNIDV